MLIGVPKEIKQNENRVALTPGIALELTQSGHEVLVEKTAGISSGFSDSDYEIVRLLILQKRSLTVLKWSSRLKNLNPMKLKCADLILQCSHIFILLPMKN